jgi:hypothetical protein
MNEIQNEYRKYRFNELEIGSSYRSISGNVFKLLALTEKEGYYVLQYRMFSPKTQEWDPEHTSRSPKNTENERDLTTPLQKISRLEELMVTGE